MTALLEVALNIQDVQFQLKEYQCSLLPQYKKNMSTLKALLQLVHNFIFASIAITYIKNNSDFLNKLHIKYLTVYTFKQRQHVAIHHKSDLILKSYLCGCPVCWHNSDTWQLCHSADLAMWPVAGVFPVPENISSHKVCRDTHKVYTASNSKQLSGLRIGNNKLKVS